MNRTDKMPKNAKMKVSTAAGIAVILMIALIITLTEIKQTLAITETELQILKSDLLSIGELKEEMALKGFGVERISEMMDEGYAYLKDENYAAANKSVISARKIRDDAFSGYTLLSAIDEMIKDINKTNQESGSEQLSITEELLWSIGYAREEFEKENYEGAKSRAEGIKNIILTGVRQRYGLVEETLTSMMTDMEEKSISTRRAVTLKNLASGYLKDGAVSELNAIDEEINRINSVLGLYNGVEESIASLDERNLSSSRIRDGLESATEKISAGEYGRAETIIKEQEMLVKKAISLQEKSASAKADLEKAKEAGLVSKELAESISNALVSAEHELAIGNYEGAEEKLGKAEKERELIEAEMLVKKASAKRVQTIKEVLTAAGKALLIIIIIAIPIIIFGRKAVLKRISSSRLKRLERELEVSKKMVSELQTRYFVKHAMPRDGYDEAYEELQEKIMRIKDKISYIKQKSATPKHMLEK